MTAHDVALRIFAAVGVALILTVAVFFFLAWRRAAPARGLRAKAGFNVLRSNPGTMIMGYADNSAARGFQVWFHPANGAEAMQWTCRMMLEYSVLDGEPITENEALLEVPLMSSKFTFRDMGRPAQFEVALGQNRLSQITRLIRCCIVARAKGVAPQDMDDFTAYVTAVLARAGAFGALSDQEVESYAKNHKTL